MTTTHFETFEIAPVFNRAFDALRARAEALGRDRPILFGAASGPAALRDGTGFTDLVDQRQWEAMHGELWSGLGDGAGVPALADLHDRADQLERGVIPIALIDLGYHRPGRRLARALFQARKADQAIALPADDDALLERFETRQAFVASALLPPVYWGFDRQPDRHFGLQARFCLSSALLIANGPRPGRVEIDFDDGQGPRPIAWDEVLAVDYDAPGARRMVLTAHYADGVRTAAFSLDLEEAAPVRTDAGDGPQPAAGWNKSISVTAQRQHDNVTYSGTAYVYYAWSNHSRKVRKPILLAEGFPGGNDPDYIYRYFDGYTPERWNDDAKLANALRDAGYDLVILIFGKKGAPIQGNAYVYQRALKVLSEEAGGKVAAMGGSMGGLIARYALAHAQTHSVDVGQVSCLMSFDSPHCGANLPLSVQFTARFFGKEAQATNDLLNLDCTKQMLMHQLWLREGTEPVVKEQYLGFYRELEKLGTNGYPSGIKKYAVCNGDRDGLRISNPETHALTVSRSGQIDGRDYHAIHYTTPSRVLTQRHAYGDCYFSDLKERIIFYIDPSPGGFYTRDGCAGGRANQFEQACLALRRPCAEETLHLPNNCFIPSYSALGVKWEGSAYDFKAAGLQRGQTPFDEWYVVSGNAQHCTVDKGIKAWVLEIMKQVENAGALEAAE